MKISSFGCLLGYISFLLALVAPLSANPSATTSLAPPQADLSVSATTDREFAIAGETLLYTVSVNNAGPNFAPSTNITIMLPNAVSLTETDGCVGDPAGVPICKLQTVAIGETKQATFLVRVDNDAAGSLRAEISVESNRDDPDPSNNSVTTQTPISTETVVAAGSSPTIASDPTSSERFTIAWVAPPAAANLDVIEGSDGIRTQLFDATGMPVGIDLRLDQSGSSHSHPKIARRADGQFVAVWQSQDAEDSGVFGRLFDATGMPVGIELRLNVTEDRGQSLPSVAGFGDGRFAATWSDEESLGSFVRALRLFDATGMPVGIELRFGASDIATKPPAIAVSNSRILVTWEDAAERVAAQLFDLTGMPVGIELQIAPSGVNAHPRASQHPDGGFVIVWQNDDDLDGSGIFGRRLDLTGMPVGIEFRVNELIAGDQQEPAITTAPDGTFAVSWQGPDADGTGIYARRLGLTGMPVGIELRMNLNDSGNQSAGEPAFIDGDGTFYVAWQSDEDESEIVIAPPNALFTDGFESGDLTSWSDQSP